LAKASDWQPFLQMTGNRDSLLEVDSLSVRISGHLILDHISFSIGDGQCLAVMGNGGSGKTTLVQALAGGIYHHGTIRFRDISGHPAKRLVIGRQHRFKNLSNLSSFYYQQRFNSFDAEDSRTVEDELKLAGAGMHEIEGALEKLGIAHLRHTGLIQLSNGEHKRFQMAEALLQGADWLLLDCPYIGLDVSARQMLNEILDELVLKGTKILLVSGHADLPSCITDVAILDRGSIRCLLNRHEYDNTRIGTAPEPTTRIDPGLLQKIPKAFADEDFDVAIQMVDTSITYDDRTILDKINWMVRKGECWQVAGPNGSGKSTLLSLVNGDNPQAFANEIYLFDRRKGSGESIWDIKRKIGYVSPELHHYFEAGSTCFDVVASGLFDTMGLFRRLNEDQRLLANRWMELLHVSHLAEKYFQRLSDGEQRRVLLARAMVKNPPMLILDEPCQGLDDTETKSFTSLIDAICTMLGKTLIYVSHYQAELPSCVNKRLELAGGRVVSISG